jgi:diguanylate cyclase (GGDEF)-like protein
MNINDMLRFLAATTDTGAALSASYDGVLVVVSYVVAALASYAGLLMSERIGVAESVRGRWAWLSAGSVTMGIGVWAMHFLGMLAFVLPIPVAYNLDITIASAVPAILASAVALSVMGGNQHGYRQYIIAGTLLGAGIGGTHYTGMAAMLMNADMRYDPGLFALSILVAVGLGIAALYAHDLRLGILGFGKSRRLHPLGAAVMGLAVAGMHYTAMGATYFFPIADKGIDDLALDPHWLSVGVTAITILIVLLAIAATSVDKKLQSATELLRLANHDPLTGLPTRQLFDDRLNHAAAHAKRLKGSIALLYVDLDDFKLINDTLGHVAGDMVLKEVAKRLQAAARETDTVARLGGDEFTVIMEPQGNRGSAEGLSARILQSLSEPISIGNRDCTVGASIGIGVSPAEDFDKVEFVKMADAAMYEAKNARGNTYRARVKPDRHVFRNVSLPTPTVCAD